MDEICQNTLNAVLKCCSPRRVILYGEKVTAVEHNCKAMDFCIIMDCLDTMSRSQLLSQLYLNVAAPIPVQFTVYRTEDWEALCKNPTSYAAHIKRKGTVLYEQSAT